jgi:hypothetical protein
MKTKAAVSIARVKRPARRERQATSFSQRWRGKFQAAGRDDERYKTLAKRYL